MRAIAILVLTAFMLSSCGAIMHGTRQDITINSSPSGANAVISGDTKTTPAVFSLKRKHSYQVRISKDGYESADFMINNKLDWTAWADLFLWGIIPIFYDLASGSAWKLTPEELNVNLTRSLGYQDGPDEIPIQLALQNDSLVVSSSTGGVTIRITQID